jgi:hypothetical protein
MTDPTTTGGLWAVDRIAGTQGHIPVDRATDPIWLDTYRNDITGTFCRVDAYRAATTRHGTIPSLWDQSTLALFGGEVGGEAGGKLAEERSPADLDLLEIRSQIRHGVREERARLLNGAKDPLGLRHRADGTRPEFQPSKELRSLSSLLITHDPRLIDWWAHRLTSWGNALETYLNVKERAAQPFGLRGVPCPECLVRRVIAEDNGTRVERPALTVEVRNGMPRAAVCAACGSTWFAGDQLAALAAWINPVATAADTPTIAG